MILNKNNTQSQLLINENPITENPKENPKENQQENQQENPIKTHLLNKNKNNKIYNLVFSGGGLRGIAFIGVYKFLYKKKLLKYLKAISCCSAGSLIGLLVNINLDYKDLEEFIKNFNIEELKAPDYINFIDNLGLESGLNIINIMKLFLNKKNINENITFKELYDLTHIKLYINTVCLNDYTIHYNSIDTSPNMPVLLAIRMSISIPFIFTPVMYENKMYVDGGLIDNIPVSMFDNDIKHTLVIKLSDVVFFDKIKTIDKLLLSTFNCIFYNLSKHVNADKYNIVLINTNNNVSIFLYELNQKLKIKLINQGFITIRNYYLQKN
jgi:predicted acylesterase/phospholipase RssA